MMTLLQIYELAISMVTALLGLAYPMFIDKISSITEKYKSRQLSERFKKEFAYQLFNLLLIICIVGMFTLPFVLSVLQNRMWEITLLAIQGISVFVLSMCMVVLFHLLLTYNDPERLFERICISDDKKQKIIYLRDLIKYAASDEELTPLFNRCMNEFFQIMLEFQRTEIKNNVK